MKGNVGISKLKAQEQDWDGTLTAKSLPYNPT